MAIAFANLGSSATPDLNNGLDATSYATGLWTPPTEGILLCFVFTRQAAGLNGPPAVGGNGVTWVQIGTMTYDGGTRRITLFAALAAGATNDATGFEFEPDIQLCCVASFFQVTGADVSGGLAAAFVQTPNGTGTGTTGTVTFAAAGNAANRCISFFDHDFNEAASGEGGDWTTMDSFAGAGPARGLISQANATAFDTTSTATWTNSVAWGGLGAEIKAAAEGDGAIPAYLPGRRVSHHFHGPAQVGTSAATKYTAPAGYRALLRHVHVSNPSGSPVDFTLSIGTDAAAVRLFDGLSIPADSYKHWFLQEWLNPGDVIQAFAGTASALVLTLDGYERPAG